MQAFCKPLWTGCSACQNVKTTYCFNAIVCLNYYTLDCLVIPFMSSVASQTTDQTTDQATDPVPVTNTPTGKVGVLLLNLGGPDSLSAVKPFLYNLFADPDIINIPLSQVFQKPLAWLIATSRGDKVATYYDKMGGRSPILPLTQAQADALHDQLLDPDTGLGQDVPVYIAMRYWHPFTDETVRQILADGIDHLVVLPMYPQFSYTTTGSSLNELEKQLASLGGQAITLSVVPPFYKHPTYLTALGDTIREGLASYPWTCPINDVHIVFSAHSLPRRHIKRTNDPYPQQILETAQRVMAEQFADNPWDLGFQSKVGPIPWLGPDTEGVLHYMAATQADNVLMVPISFVSDHLETLYEIDMLYLPLGDELGIPHCHRAKALNNTPNFINTLTQLVKTTLAVI
jgi:protoporphyrin/coproporphyrin ferrochelatase